MRFAQLTKREKRRSQDLTEILQEVSDLRNTDEFWLRNYSAYSILTRPSAKQANV